MPLGKPPFSLNYFVITNAATLRVRVQTYEVGVGGAYNLVHSNCLHRWVIEEVRSQMGWQGKPEIQNSRILLPLVDLEGWRN